jgi:hypothetical protein
MAGQEARGTSGLWLDVMIAVLLISGSLQAGLMKKSLT